ncbi:G-type lectin S-receptor-like serine/threonine-protein kinase At2g19130 [Papaver somniferum]|uniref:G-type lectin S-receptor-like serine/threonine-protein kinase At2g19130 n=1 Tax=Papaver somniferum TaxID=3469 RepID=UPI000E7017B6|nr:G-type lectin S-receptor-like serine/threonine-protein kinase At2g19130 [Papaver somniferum]
MDTQLNNSCFFLSILVFGFVMCSKPRHTIAADTISLGESLTGYQTMISRGDRFVLGFFEPDWSLQDSTGGCVRRTPLQCESKDGFLTIPTSKLPDEPRLSPIYGSEECKLACEGSCACIAYAFIGNGCRTWDKDIINFNQFTPSGGPTTFYLRLAASEIRSIATFPSSPVPVSTAQARNRKAIVWKIVLPVFTLVATIMGVLGYIYLLKRNKANKRGRLKGLQGVLTDLLKSKSTYIDSPNTNMFNDGITEGETQ